MKTCRLAIIVAAALFTLLAVGAGASAAGLAGTYADKNGVTQLAFKNDRVTITRLGIMQGIFKYTLDGSEITVEGANSGQAMLLEIDDKGCIIGVPGAGELCKVNAGSDAGMSPKTETSTVSGVYTGTDPNGDSYRFDFHDDGTVEMSSDGVNVTATYTVEGRKVTVTAPKSAGGDIIAMQIDDAGCLIGSDMGKLCKSGASTEASSSPTTDTSGVWGVYTATDPTKGTARWVFYNDGKVEMTTAGASLTATYTVDGKMVTITAPKGAGGDVFVLETDDKGCLYNPKNPSAVRLCKQ